MGIKFRLFKSRGDFYSWVFDFAIFPQSRKPRNEVPITLVYTRDVNRLMSVIDLIVGAGAAKTAKRSRSSKKGKRPLSACAVPAPKQPKLLKEEGKVRFWVI